MAQRINLATHLDEVLTKFSAQSQVVRVILYVLIGEILFLTLYYIVMIATLSAQQNERVELRRSHIGFIFQTFGLLPYLYVEIPLRLAHCPRKERDKRVAEALSMLGLSRRSQHRTFELSGGEQQRVAIARALVNRPSLILANEPTGQLDSATGAGIIRLLREITDQTRVTIVIATHDPNVWEAAHIVFELQDGQLINENKSSYPDLVSFTEIPKHHFLDNLEKFSIIRAE